MYLSTVGVAIAVRFGDESNLTSTLGGGGIANAMTEGVRVFEIQVKLLQPRIARQLPREGAKRLVSLRSRRQSKNRPSRSFASLSNIGFPFGEAVGVAD